MSDQFLLRLMRGPYYLYTFIYKQECGLWGAQVCTWIRWNICMVEVIGKSFLHVNYSTYLIYWLKGWRKIIVKFGRSIPWERNEAYLGQLANKLYQTKAKQHLNSRPTSDQSHNNFIWMGHEASCGW